MVDFNYIMDVTPRKRASIIALRKHTVLSIRNISEKLSQSQLWVTSKRDLRTLMNHGHYDMEDVEESARHTAGCQGNDKK